MNPGKIYQKTCLRVFQWRGVDVYLDATVLLLVIFYSDIAAKTQWGQDPVLTSWLIGGLVIFSVIIHELAHAWVGTLLGAEVDKIYLNILAGACVFKTMPTSQWRNMVISLAGPFSNILLWLMFSSIYQQEINSTNDYTWSLVLWSGAQVNFILAILNLFPAFPLDGGQAMRALLVIITGRDLIAAWLMMLVGSLVGLGVSFLLMQTLLSGNLSILNLIFILALIIVIVLTSYLQLKASQDQSWKKEVAPDLQRVFKQANGPRKIADWYNKELGRFNFPYQSNMLTTRYGPTHLLTMGRQDAPALVLLAGPNDSALYLSPLFEALGQRYRLYAPDFIGGLGKSAAVRLSLDDDSLALWLKDILDQLNLEQATFITDELGGLLFKLHRLEPERIASAVLIVPKGLLPFSAVPAHRSARVVFFSQLCAIWFNPVTARWLLKSLRTPGSRFSPQSIDNLARQLIVTHKYYERIDTRKFMIEPELQAEFNVPTMLLLGEKMDYYNPVGLLEHCQNTLPQLQEAEIVAGTTHDLINEQTDYLIERLLRFLAKPQPVPALSKPEGSVS